MIQLENDRFGRSVARQEISGKDVYIVTHEGAETLRVTNVSSERRAYEIINNLAPAGWTWPEEEPEEGGEE